MERQSELELDDCIIQYNLRYGWIIACRQTDIKKDNEKSSRDQNFEAEKREKISQVGESHTRRKQEEAPSRNSARLPHSLADWLTTRTEEIGISNH
jgi:hypothetical protein